MNVSIFKNDCCGCGVCSSICPSKAITMQLNQKGFYYPHVDDTKCSNCSHCVSQCSFNSTENKSNSLLSAWAVKHTSSDVRQASRSGGVFTSISDYVLEQNGIVYGCELIENDKALHTRATTAQERNKFRGSKYIQSATYHIYESVKNDLLSGYWVLFSGTPCQVDALVNYCKNVNQSKLITVDIVCHGVPSSLIWSDYLEYIMKKFSKTIKSVEFRDKITFGWSAHEETFTFTDDTKVSSHIFRQLFYNHLILRESCFICPYKKLNRVGDISIADCWGITNNYPEFDDNKGVSLVLVNTAKGTAIFNNLNSIDSISVDINKLMQPCLEYNWEIPDNYNEFWSYYSKHGFQKVIDKYIYNKPPRIKELINRLNIKTRNLLLCFFKFFRSK